MVQQKRDFDDGKLKLDDKDVFVIRARFMLVAREINRRMNAERTAEKYKNGVPPDVEEWLKRAEAQIEAEEATP